MSFGDTFKALSDPTRREILNLLKQGSMTAGSSFLDAFINGGRQT